MVYEIKGYIFDAETEPEALRKAENFVRAQVKAVKVAPVVTQPSFVSVARVGSEVLSRWVKS